MIKVIHLALVGFALLSGCRTNAIGGDAQSNVKESISGEEWVYKCKFSAVKGTYAWAYVSTVSSREAERDGSYWCTSWDTLGNFCTTVRSGSRFGPQVSCHLGTSGALAYTWGPAIE